MSRWRNLLTFLILIGLLLAHPNLCSAQLKSEKPDSVIAKTNPDTVNISDINQLRNIDGEIELSEINIEAVIEKPRVAILPKRIEPELGELEFVNRSFEKELKKMPEKPMMLDDRLLVPKKIENLREKLLKKKNELIKHK